MKKKIFVLLLFVLIAWFIPGCYISSVSQDNGTGYNSTYPEYNVDDLNQYGEWVDVNPYGRVWYPSVVNDWQPFTNGHWTWDGSDWVWVSYEPFGWIVYHYGSWENSPEYGWIWIPTNEEWSPANVQWIDYGDNVGWAPRRANNRSWPEPWENNNMNPWMVVKMGDFNRENITSYRERNVTRVENVNQTPIQRRQPDVKTVQRYVKDPIGVVKFEREPVVTNNPPLRTKTPPERTTPPPERTYTPPEKTTTPPVISRNTPPPNQQKSRQIVHMQVPPNEKQKVDKYRPKVEKEVLKKKVKQPEK